MCGYFVLPLTPVIPGPPEAGEESQANNWKRRLGFAPTGSQILVTVNNQHLRPLAPLGVTMKKLAHRVSYILHQGVVAPQVADGSNQCELTNIREIKLHSAWPSPEGG